MATALRITEVPHPPGQERVELSDHPFEANASIPSGNVTDTLLGPLKALGGDGQHTTVKEPVAEELSFTHMPNRTLVPVDT